MTEIRRRKNHININTLKISKISLLKQSNLNKPLKRLFLPKSKINKIRQISSVNNIKKSVKPFNIYFSPIDNHNINTNKKENNNKPNPLTEKNRIIKKHNILQKIDFNINQIKNSGNNNNIKIELNLFNNIDNNLYIYNDISSLYNNTISTHKNNSSNISNKNNNNNFIQSLNLPLLTHNNKETFPNSNIVLKNSKISLKKKAKTPSSLKNLKSYNSSPSIKCLTILKHFNKLFTNEKIKNIQNLKRLKPNYTEQSLNTKFDYFINNENNKGNNKNEEYIINNENEESSSNEDNCDIKEIEKIISTTENENKKEFNSYNYNISSINNSENSRENKKDYILLDSLFKVKNYKINKKKNIKKSKTTRNIFLNDNSNKRNELNIGNNIENKNNNLKKNIFNINNNSKENNNLNEKKNINLQNYLMTYDYQNKNNKKNKIYNLIKLMNYSKIQHFLKYGNY